MARIKQNKSRAMPGTRAGKNLTAAQRQAAELFATNDVKFYRVEDIAKEVGVSCRTIYRWKQDPDFIEYQNEVADKAMEEFLTETYTVLKGIVRSGRSDSAKLKGIELVLKNRGKLQEVQKIEATIEDRRSDEAIEQEIEQLERELGLSFEEDEPSQDKE